MSTTTHLDWPGYRRCQNACLGAGAAGLTLCALGALLHGGFEQVGASYLLAFLSWLALGVGSLGLLLLHHLTGGAWGLALRRLLEAAAGTLPLLVLLFVPIALKLGSIFPWTHESDEHPLGEKAAYLNVPFFLVRAAIYFVVWSGLTWLLRRASDAHDRTGDPAWLRQAEQLSGPGLVLYGLTVTFAAVDWIMSLEPHWFSSIFGALVATGQLLPSLALAIAAATLLLPRARNAAATDPDVWNDLGNLLLAFVMLWTYMSFSQYLLIWSGNLPEEIIWYVHRTEGGWQVVGVALAVFYFALPFVLLLSRNFKRNPRRLRQVAVVILVVHFLHHYWLVAPSFSPGRHYLHWLDVAALVGVGGTWSWMYLWLLQARPLMPLHAETAGEVLNHA